MKLILNEKPIESIPGPQTSLGEALTGVQQSHVGANQVISAIFVDGQALTADLLEAWKDRPCGEFHEARIDAPDRRELAVHSLRVLAEGLRESHKDRQRISELCAQGQPGQAMDRLAQYLNLWNNTQLTLGAAARLLNAQLESLEVPVGGADDGEGTTTIAARLGELTEQLAQLKQALEAEDYVLLGDVLEYEFAPLTDAWRVMLGHLATYFEQSPA